MLAALRLLTVLLAAIAALVASPPGASAQIALEAPGAPAEPAPEPEAPSVSEVLRLLATVLDNPEARAALLEQLRAADPAEPPPPGAAPAEPEADPTIPQVIAEQTMQIAEQVSDEIVEVVRSLVNIRAFVTNARDVDFAAVTNVLLTVGLVMAATFVTHWLMRRLVRRPIAGLALRAHASPVGPRFGWKLVAVLADLATVAVAWAAGWVTAFLVGGGEIALAEGLFLHAFAVAEAAKVGIRLVFRPRFSHLRLIPMVEPTARHWNFWTSRIASILGYGLLFAVPLSEPYTSTAFSGWLQLLVIVTAFVLASILILRNRRRVRDAIDANANAVGSDVLATGLRLIARTWHLIAIGYLAALFVVWRAHPGNAEQFMLRATAFSAVAILAGSLISAVLARRTTTGIRLSEKIRTELPTLEDRLNLLVPRAVMVARAIVLVVVLAVILTVWGLFDAPGWLATDIGWAIVSSVLWIAGILLVAGAVWIVVSSWIEYRLNPNVGTQPTPRERTLLALFSNAFVIVLAVITVMGVLNELGINVAPLIAGAGVIGLAIGFGAQKLVQDIINGAFIQFENTMNEGDVVTAGGTTGVVEKLTIRSVSLRDVNGCYHMIPFSGVDTVTNFMKGFSWHVADIGVAYRENIAEVKEAMQEAFERLMETEHRANILPPLDMQGITAFADSAVMVRCRIKTLPGQQWATGRAFNEVMKAVFDERGIEIPFPHRTLYMGELKDGSAPPLNLRSVDGPAASRERPAPAGPADVIPPDRELTPPSGEEVN